MPLRVAAVLAALACASPLPAAEPNWWSDEVEQALKRAKENRTELEKALAKVPKELRKGMAFLVGNMPDSDLTSLTADFLLSNVELAYKARKEAP